MKIGGTDHVILVPSMTAVRHEGLRETRGQLVAYRDAIVAALDYLFLGV